jgi:hypothetical protein
MLTTSESLTWYCSMEKVRRESLWTDQMMIFQKMSLQLSFYPKTLDHKLISFRIAFENLHCVAITTNPVSPV